MISIDNFASLVDAIYEAGLDAQRWPDTLAHLAAATGSNVADLKLADMGRVRFTMFLAGMDPAAIDAYDKFYYRLDPITPAVERKPAGTLITDREVVPKTSLTRTEFYNDWVRPQDFDDCAVITLFRDETRLAMICLAAPDRARCVRHRIIGATPTPNPHLQRATHVTLKMADLDALRSAGLDALDCLSEGVVWPTAMRASYSPTGRQRRCSRGPTVSGSRPPGFAPRVRRRPWLCVASSR